MVGITNAGGGGEIKRVHIEMLPITTGKVSYCTIGAGSIGFKPKFIVFNYSTNEYGTGNGYLVDVEAKGWYGASMGTDVVFPDGSAYRYAGSYTAASSRWPVSPTATPVAVTYVTYDGVQYARVRDAAFSAGFNLITMWIHADGSIRMWWEDKYGGADIILFQCVLIG